MHHTGHHEPKSFFEKPQERFINRELSWLEFNTRVLEEAFNHHQPLLERVKFLSISASNLDEFYMVRVAGLKDQVKNKIARSSNDGLTPRQQLKLIYKKAEELFAQQQKCWQQLKKELAKERVHIVSRAELNKKDKTWLEEYFLNNIFPALSPIAIDPAHPFPFLPNLSLAMLVQLADVAEDKPAEAIIPIPPNLERFVKLPGKDRLILLEEVVSLFEYHLFANEKIAGSGLIHITRDSDLEIEEDAEDLVSHFETAVQKRRRGSVIHIKVNTSMPRHMLDFVIAEMKLAEGDVVEMKEMLAMDRLLDLYAINRPKLKFEHYEERFPERINDFGGDCFAAIAAKDIIIHHPYETFDVVVQFLHQAARDPDVVTIKQTLYRTSSDSPIVKALVEAASAGKSVTVVVELKARFDEEANIRWARDLERAGAQVVFGFVQLKTHAKVSLVVRRENEELKSYVHFGTGNYHSVTAKVYSDLSFFTCNHDLCNDAAYLFNYLTGYSPPKHFSKIFVSPLTLRKHVIKLIDAEIEHAKAGRPAAIWAKLNALVDPDVIDKLYHASQAGVKIDLVVRGICCLRPGIHGLSEHIHVRSIVGRYLEHARLLCFGAGHGLPSDDAKVYITSADWMHRNFDRRVEVLVPIENPTVHEQVMGQIMQANLKDKKQSWRLHADGSYMREKAEADSFCAHEYFMNNPSLSGRGKAVSAEESEQQRRKIYLLGKDKPEA